MVIVEVHIFMAQTPKFSTLNLLVLYLHFDICLIFPFYCYCFLYIKLTKILIKLYNRSKSYLVDKNKYKQYLCFVADIFLNVPDCKPVCCLAYIVVCSRLQTWVVVWHT